MGLAMIYVADDVVWVAGSRASVCKNTDHWEGLNLC